MLDALYYPYPSRRSVVYGTRGMVVTSQPLAAQAGLDILKKGGNAIDAAIAAAGCLTVVEPTSNGIGGDAFALVWAKDKLYGLNASGPAPLSISGNKLIEKGYNTMPQYGWIPVNVPGIPAAWAGLSQRFGRLSLVKVLQPAIEYAEKGYPVSPIISELWQECFRLYKNLKGEEFKHWFYTFALKDRAPLAGEVWRCPKLAQTLQEIAETYAESFYRGKLAQKIDDFSTQYGGYLRGIDLANYYPQWVEPIKTDYRGYEVWELPPNGQGVVALMALNILKGFEFTANQSLHTYHHQIEAIKLAFAEGLKYITDPRYMKVSVNDLLADSFAQEKRRLIEDRAIEIPASAVNRGGTVYLATADSEGNMVSYIQSNYLGFGSALVVPDTGISLHNRGHIFSLDPKHANFLQPGKKTYHTIIPGFLTKDRRPVGSFGVMGGYVQPQGHVQVLMNTIDFQLNPQAALDAPRWQWIAGKTIEVEPQFPEAIAQALARKGHTIKRTLGDSMFGRGQIIWRDKNGVLIGATEPRADGVVAAW